MNLKALYTLSIESPASITGLAEQQGLDPVVSLGVLKLLLANDGNLASLSPRQKQHFELSIKPLLDP
jgi:hypothetical protein